MKGYYIEIKNNEDLNEILKIINTISLAYLQKELGIKNTLLECSECGTSLYNLIRKYETFPTDDLTFFIEWDKESKKYSIVQYASGTGDCRKMKENNVVIVDTPTPGRKCAMTTFPEEKTQLIVRRLREAGFTVVIQETGEPTS